MARLFARDGSLQRSLVIEPRLVAIFSAGIAATVVGGAAAWVDAPAVLVAVALALAAGAVVLVRPAVLFYAYCAAIPFNFLLPPGPGGTVARIIALVFFAGYVVRRPDALRFGAIPVVGWLFLGWTLASTLWAINGHVAFTAWISVAQLFGISILVASLVASRRVDVRVALWAYAAAATVTALVGAIAYLGGAAGFLARAAGFESQGPALFASILLPAAIFLMSEVESPRSHVAVRIGSLACLFACVGAIALSGTRSAWVALAVTALLWIVFRPSAGRVVAVAGATVAVAALAALVPGAWDFIMLRAGGALETGGAGRTDIWTVGVYLLGEAPFIGVGLANFPVAFTSYAIGQVAGASIATGELYAGRAPHNVLLGIAVETGIIGAGLLVALFAAALRSSGATPLGMTVRVGLVALLVQALFLDILLQKQLWLFLALVLGLAAPSVAATAQTSGRAAPQVRSA